MRVIVLFIVLHVVSCLEINRDLNLTWSSLESTTNSALHSVIKSYLPTILKTISKANISNSCQRGLMTYMIALRRSKTWAIEMIDATAKIPSGILRGATMDFGEFDECLEIRVPQVSRISSTDEKKFRGRYCTIGLQSDLLFSAIRRLEDPNYTDPYGEPPELVKSLFKKFGGMLSNMKNFFGVCIPSLCSKIDLQRISTAILKPLGVKATVLDCQIDEPYSWPLHSAVALSALVVLAAICVLGTTLDIMKRKSKTDYTEKDAAVNSSSTSIVQEHMLFRFLEAFSVLANSEKLMHVDSQSSSLYCFHGIRFLTATWIILGHTYIYPVIWRYYTRRNITNYLESSNDIFWKVIDNFTVAVDTFFFISGFLLVYCTWQRMKKNKGKLDLFKFFISKYLRMTPALCFVMTLLMVMPAIDSGPLWNLTLNPLVENCQVRWWWNFLYVSNFINTKRMCLDYSWHLATLMQLHILGVATLMVFYRFRVLGVILGLLLSAIFTAIILFQILWKNFGPIMLKNMYNFDKSHEFATMVYVKPHYHFMCYLIGMTVAYFLLKYKEKKLSRMHQILGWCCAVGLALFSVYGTSLNDENRPFAIFHMVTYRPAWALGFGWLVFMCCSGSGGFVNFLLSHRIMHPLGQLSYMLYLTHPLIIIYRSSSQRERIYFNHSEQVFIFFSTLLSSIFLAFIGCVTVEIPFQNLLKIMFEGAKKEKKVENKRTEDNSVTTNNP